MRAVLQRVLNASVTIEGEHVASIDAGLLILLGVAQGDGPEEARKLAAKSAELRIFPADEGRFDRSLLDHGGEALVVSQFTLLADVRRGRRPSFVRAAAPDEATKLVDVFVRSLRDAGPQFPWLKGWIAPGRKTSLAGSRRVPWCHDEPAQIRHIPVHGGVSERRGLTDAGNR